MKHCLNRLKMLHIQNRKKQIACVVALTILLTTMSAFAAAPKVDAKSYVLLNAKTGEVLHESNSDMVLVPASMVKMMTMYLTLENIERQKLKWTDVVTISNYSNKVSRQPSLSSFQLPAGKTYSVQELFYATALNSSNAAAIALAEHIGGTEGRFVEMMNQKAQDFGLNDVKFVNSCGLNNIDLMGNHPENTGQKDDTKLSAKSMATIAYRLINDYPIYETISVLPQKIIREGQPDQIIINSTNKILPGKQFAVDGAKGLKTGYTFNAGFCFAGYVVRDAGSMLSVVMGATSTEERFRGSGKLLEYGYSMMEDAKKKNETVKQEDDSLAATPSYLYPDKINTYLKPAKDSDLNLMSKEFESYIRRFGNTGFGVMDNGKMDFLMLNGLMYCISKNGRVSELSIGSGVGQASMTFFEREQEMPLKNIANIVSLENVLKEMVKPTTNNYCFKITGKFHPKKSTTICNDTVEFNPGTFSGAGTIVAFWNQASADPVLKAGFTFYYLDQNKKIGGVLKEVVIEDVMVYADQMNSLADLDLFKQPIQVA